MRRLRHRIVSHGYTVWSAVLLVMVLVAWLLHLPVAFRMGIHGDEFRFLSDLYQFRAGSKSAWFQSFHVHIFGWLANVGDTEVDKILAARATYFALLGGSSCFLFLIARRFLSASASLFAVLCFVTFRQIILTGTSFRYDGLSAFFLLAAAALLLRDATPFRSLFVGACLFALSALTTVKAVFYVPTFACLVLLRHKAASPQRRVRDLATFGALTLLALGIGFVLHGHTLGTGTAGESIEMIQRSGTRFLTLESLFPARDGLVSALVGNPVTWIMLLAGASLIVARVIGSEQDRDALLLLSLLLPLASLAVYRNAFAYFYTFIMPTALVMAGVSFDNLLAGSRSRNLPRAFLLLVIAGLVTTTGINYRNTLRHELLAGGRVMERQKEILQNVHTMFPNPVPYIDAVSMVSSFPKVGFFMSRAGFLAYQRNAPLFASAVEDYEPRFLLANRAALRVVFSNKNAGLEEQQLHRDDVAVLRRSYVHHWGPIYVLGASKFVPAGEVLAVDIVVPGEYTVEAEGSLVINNNWHEPGDVVQLSRGEHRIGSPARSQLVLLRWGNHLFRPT